VRTGVIPLCCTSVDGRRILTLMRRGGLVAAIVAAIGAFTLPSCASSSVDMAQQGAPSPVGQPGVATTAGPEPTIEMSAGPPTYLPLNINWDNPEGNATPLAAPSDAAAPGVVGFRPVIPKLAAPIARTLISPTGDLAHRSLYFIFHFPSGPDFPSDGHLVVTEYPSSRIDPSGFGDVAAEWPGTSVITIRGSQALLFNRLGVGRLMMALNDVAIDISGPAVSPQVVRRIAEQIARAAAGT